MRVDATEPYYIFTAEFPDASNTAFQWQARTKRKLAAKSL
jgi:hypothetical protein